ncbi:MAG: hypothetical protein AAGD14_10250 [Planctomycetota bacterium]
MRNRERGIGNMAFISVLILFVVAAALAFVWKDEGDQAKADLAKARAQVTASDTTINGWKTAYNAVIEVTGMSNAALQGSGDVAPERDAIQNFFRGEIHKKAEECDAAGSMNLKTANYTADESTGKIERGEGDAVTVKFFSNPISKENATFKQFLDLWPAPLVKAKAVTEANNGKNDDMYNSFQERLTIFTDGLSKAQTDFQNQVNEKQALIDQQVQDLTGLRESVENSNAKFDAMSTTVESTKVEAEQKARADALQISALQNRVANMMRQQEIALAEDPADGSVLVVSNIRGTVFINLGKANRLKRGTRFKVWRAGKGSRRQDIAVIRVISVDNTKAECEVVRKLSSAGISEGMNVSNPFFDPRGQLRAYIFGNLSGPYTTETARTRLARAGIVVTRFLDDQVDIVVLGEPQITVEEVEDEEEAEGARRRNALERSKRLEEVLEKARSINALVVTQETLSTFIEY